MAGRRPRSGTESARPGPVSGGRWAWPSPPRPGPAVPAGRRDDQAGQEILERTPGRWSPSRLGGPPRWLLTVIAVLVLAGGVTAFVTGGLRHGQPEPGRPSASVAARPVACGYIIGPVAGFSSASIKRGTSPGGGCARPGAGPGRAGGSRPGSAPICVPLHVQPGQHTAQFGVRHRCYPGLA